MNRFAGFLLVLLFIFAAAGCSGGGPPNAVHSPEDVNGRIIGALSGSASALLAGELGVAHTFIDTDEMMDHLRIGTVDCVIMERVLAEETVVSVANVRVIGEPLLEYDLRFAVAKENNQLLMAVNEALVALSDNGTLGALRGKYFAGRNYTYTPSGEDNDSTRYLSLAVPNDSPPFSYIDSNGEHTGLDVEVARAVSDYLGVELRITEVDVSELVSAVWYGNTDLSMGWLPDDIGDFVDVSDSYAASAHVVIVRN